MTFYLPSFWSNSNKKSRSDIVSIVDDFFNTVDRDVNRSFLSKDLEKDFNPSLDISETNSHYSIEVELPGIDKKDISIKADKNVLSIKGKKALSKDSEDKNYYTRERFFGSFQRALALPHDIYDEDINATFKDGVLTIKVPKKEISTAKAIDIKEV